MLIIEIQMMARVGDREDARQVARRGSLPIVSGGGECVKPSSFFLPRYRSVRCRAHIMRGGLAAVRRQQKWVGR